MDRPHPGEREAAPVDVSAVQAAHDAIQRWEDCGHGSEPIECEEVAAAVIAALRHPAPGEPQGLRAAVQAADDAGDLSLGHVAHGEVDTAGYCVDCDRTVGYGGWHERAERFVAIRAALAGEPQDAERAARAPDWCTCGHGEFLHYGTVCRSDSCRCRGWTPERAARAEPGLREAATVVLSDLYVLLDNPPHHPIVGVHQHAAALRAALGAHGEQQEPPETLVNAALRLLNGLHGDDGQRANATDIAALRAALAPQPAEAEEWS